MFKFSWFYGFCAVLIRIDSSIMLFKLDGLSLVFLTELNPILLLSGV